MSTSAREIVGFLDAELEISRFRDYGPNGLQVPGAAEVSLVATAVSSTLETFSNAAAVGAQLLVVHHGLFWGAGPLLVDPLLKRRLTVLFDHDIGLAAYHLPLDAHPTLGNNARIAAELGLQVDGWFAESGGAPIAVHGTLAEPTTSEELAFALGELTGKPVQLFLGGPAEIRRIGICSGGAGRALPAAAALGLQAFISGEPEEDSRAQSHELGITYLAGGHHATETFGVRAVGSLLAERFGLETTFIDADNPV
jgi:dinuclear metal center YbgI/SA1388 family protein